MALPLVLLGLIPAAAYAGKKLYDSLTEDEKPTKKISYHTTTTPKSVFGNFSFYSYKKACGQKKTVRGSKNSRRLSNGTPAI